MPSPEPPPQAPATPPPPPQDLDGFVLVFAGSSPEDVSHARQLWSSLSLMPPRESRLMSANISQRLPVFRPQRSGTAASAAKALAVPEPPNVLALQQRQEEKQRYLCKAIQRREIMALLRRQRERRIQKERLSWEAKEQRTRDQQQPMPNQTPESKMDEQLVKQLD